MNNLNKAVVFFFGSIKFDKDVRKRIEASGFSILMYYTDANSDIINDAVEHLYFADGENVDFLVVYDNGMVKEISVLKKKCNKENLVFMNIDTEE